MTMAGQRKKIPLRKCTGCQEMKDKRDLLRILRTPEGEIVLDTTGKKNGRGAYLCYSLECLEKARKNRSLERSLKVKIPEDTYTELEKEIRSFEKR